LTRVDIRDWATVVIHDLLQVHRQCLQHVSAKVINEEEELEVVEVEEHGGGDDT